MKKTSFREKLLLIGMGLFVFAAGVSAVNLLFFPYARARYGWPLLGELLALALSGLGFGLAARQLARAEDRQAERLAAIAQPVFLVLLFAVHLLMGYLMEYTPSGDNFMLFNGSQMLAQDGNFEKNPDFGLYLSRYSNQWGFLLILTALEKLLFAAGVSEFFFPLVILQAALFTLGMLSLLNIAKRLRGARGVCMLILLLACCLPLWLAAAVLYTDTFSLPFILMALDFAMRTAKAEDFGRQIGWALLCGLAVVIGCQIKMTAAIVLMAAVICWALTMKPLRAALVSVLCAGILAFGMGTAHHIMLDRVIDPAMYAQHNTPPIHWVMMSIPTSDNPYGGATGDYGITWGMMEDGASREEIMDSIYARMRDRIYTLRYPNRLAAAMLRKDAAFMGDGTFGMTEMLDDRPVRENVVSSFVLEGRKKLPM